MASLNYGNWIGNLGRDPEAKQVGGTTLCEISLAVSDRVKKNGEWTEVTTWIPCKVWGQPADFLCQYAQKGSAILVQGALRLDEWTDQKTGDKRSKLYVNADRVQLLGSRDGQQARPSEPRSQPRDQRRAEPSQSRSLPADDLEDVPF